jgi:hypothetical protein
MKYLDVFVFIRKCAALLGEFVRCSENKVVPFSRLEFAMKNSPLDFSTLENDTSTLS